MVIPAGLIGVFIAIGILSLTRPSGRSVATFVVTTIIILLCAVVAFLWYNSRMTSAEIAKGNAPEILPFKDHPDPRLAQAKRMPPKCQLFLMPDPTGIEEYIPYAFGVRDSTLMPDDSKDGYYGKGDIQLYKCTQSKNSKYKKCEFASGYFQQWLFLDRMYNGPIAPLAYKPVTYCEEVKLTKDELIFPYPMVHVVDEKGDLTPETVQTIVERAKNGVIMD